MKTLNNIFYALIGISLVGITACKIAGKSNDIASDALLSALCIGLIGNALTKTDSNGQRHTDWVLIILVAACIIAIIYENIHTL